MQRSTRHIALVIAASILGAACSDATSPAAKQSELEVNRAKWAKSGFPSYEFTFRALCFCAVTEPIHVVVDGGTTIVSAMTVANNQPVDKRIPLSVLAMFDFIDRAIAKPATVLDVTYHPILGYPTRIVYDGSLMAADDEVTYTAEDVQSVASVHALSPLPDSAFVAYSFNNAHGTAPAAPARRGSAPAVTLPRSIFTAAP